MRAQRLVDHHALGRHHHAHARGVGEQDARAAPRAACRAAARRRGTPRVRAAASARAARASGDTTAASGALHAQQHAQRAARDLGQRHQAQRRAGRRAVDDDQVVAARARRSSTREQRRDLLGARQQRQLVGDHVLDALMAEQRDQVVPDPAPVPLELDARVDLERVEARRDRDGLGAEALLENVAEAVRQRRRSDERAAPARRGDARPSRRPSSSSRLPLCRCRRRASRPDGITPWHQAAETTSHGRSAPPALRKRRSEASGAREVQRCSQRGHSARNTMPRSITSSVRTSAEPQTQTARECAKDRLHGFPSMRPFKPVRVTDPVTAPAAPRPGSG